MISPTPDGAHQLRILLVDDEPLARQRMRMMLERHPDVQVLAECADGPEAVIAIDALSPDLVFLDVEMPTLDGFSVLEHLQEDTLPEVVFVSGHDRYAVRAFETHAVDYLLKPVSAERVALALDRIRTRRTAAAPGTDGPLRSFITRLRADEVEGVAPAERRTPGRIAVKHDGQLLLLSPDEITWIESDGNYVQLHARGLALTMRETMKRMESRLDPQRFVRIHRGAIINIDAIDALEPWAHGEYVVRMKDGARLMASRVYVGRLKALITA